MSKRKSVFSLEDVVADIIAESDSEEEFLNDYIDSVSNPGSPVKNVNKTTRSVDEGIVRPNGIDDMDIDDDEDWSPPSDEEFENLEPDDVDLNQPPLEADNQAQPPTRCGRGRGRGRGRTARLPAVEALNQRVQNLQWIDHDGTVPLWCPQYERPTGPVNMHAELQGKSPFEFFSLFFPGEVFNKIVCETNRYAEHYFDSTVDLPEHSRFQDWENVTVSDMKIYVATQIGMGLCSKPCVEDYWNDFWMTDTPGFTKYMTRNRFELITSFLHFSDNTSQPERNDPAYDPLYKVRKLFDITKPTYQEWYIPEREICIDESMVKFKGRLSFKQYMPNKPIKWGVKVWALCESSSGYCLDWFPYTGKQNESGLGLGHDVVTKLTTNFRGFGHHVYYDNFYSSPVLSLDLMDHSIGSCGTVRANRTGFPKNFSNIKLERGAAPLFKQSDNLTACTWQDNRRVNVLSSIHGNEVTRRETRDKKAENGVRVVHKPNTISAYNKYMGGVDLMDQLLQYYEYPHRSNKWYMPLFHRVRDVALINGYILFGKVNQQEKISHRKFREEVIKGLVKDVPSTRKRRGRKSISADQDLRLTERHFGWTPTKGYKPDCSVCSFREIKRVQTSDGCNDCKKPMCWPECYRIYHTLQEYKRAGRNVCLRKAGQTICAE